MNSLATILARLKSTFGSGRRLLRTDNLRERIVDVENRQRRMLALLRDYNERLKVLEHQGIPLPRTATDPLLTTLPGIQTPIPSSTKSSPVNQKVHLVGDHNAVSMYAKWSQPKPKLQASKDQTLGGLVTTLDIFGMANCKCVVVCMKGYPDGTAVEILEPVVGLLRSTIWAANQRIRIVWYLPSHQYIENTMDQELERFVSARLIADNLLETSEDVADNLKSIAESSYAD